jgi:hypothetical protein
VPATALVALPTKRALIRNALWTRTAVALIGVSRMFALKNSPVAPRARLETSVPPVYAALVVVPSQKLDCWPMAVHAGGPPSASLGDVKDGQSPSALRHCQAGVYAMKARTASHRAAPGCLSATEP